MLEQYYTVKLEGLEQIIVRKSRFIGYVRRVETEQEALDFIHEIKKKHHDATHNCSAYIIGEQDHIQKANDDGEPSGTAGVPMLEVLKKQSLKDTAVVVTRYFGGIKLGAGGLIRAYGTTTSKAIQKTGVVQRQLMQGISITVDYTHIGKLENELRQSDYILKNIDYQEKVIFLVFVKISDLRTFEKWIIDLTSDQASIKMSEKAYIEIPVDSTKDT